MKFAQTLFSAALCGVMLSLAANAHGQNIKSAYATVVRIQGQARYTTGDNKWHPVVVGLTLKSGGVIQTADNSMVDLILGDKINEHIASRSELKVAPAPDSHLRDLTAQTATAQQNAIRMKPNTVLAIDKLTVTDTGVDAVSDTELDLRQGTIFGNCKKLSAQSQYTIKIPNGIAGVRGTTFIVSANGAITVIAGNMVMVVVAPDGTQTTVPLGPGQQWDPSTGKVSNLTPQEFAQAMQTAVQVITVTKGIISFQANDGTLIYISPVRGNGQGHHHWYWPFGGW